MYFLTNKDNLIVAASSDFLSAVGSREICSISSMLHNQLISTDKENNLLNISNKDLSFNYTTAIMHSAFGELTLYSLAKIEEQESTQQDDEDMAYLKKIKDGSIVHVDNEYSIPDIQILKKDTKKDIEKESSLAIEQNSDKVDIEKNLNIDESIEKLADTIVKEEQELKPINLASIKENEKEIIEPEEKSTDSDIVTREETGSINLIDTENNTKEEDSAIKLPIEDNESQEKEAKKLVSIDIDENENEIVLDNTETVDNINEKVIDSRIMEIEELFKDTEEENTEEEKQDNSIETNISKEDTVIDNIEPLINTENDNKPVDSMEKFTNLEDEKSYKEENTESTISKLTKKLFPWGKKSNTIELEDKDYEIDLKSANELEGQKEPENEVKISSENIIIEPEPTLQKEENNNIKESVIKNEPENIAPKIEKDSKTDINIENSAIEPVEEKIKDKESTPSISIEKEKIDTDSESKALSLKEQIANIEIVDESHTKSTEEKNTIEVAPEIKEAVVTDTENKFVINKSNLSYKILNTQVSAINLVDNANKLSIDYSSYKMLLENYLDEIEKYNNDLLSGSSSTINMLTDAGELLSLNILTDKLNQLKSDDNRQSTIAEINLISSLIREKVDNLEEKEEPKKEEITEVIEIPEEKEDKEKLDIVIPPIPEELIDITNAKDLLSAINPNKIKFDPNRAANELNLPKNLIIEFVEDFLKQSKEHLSVITEAYNNNDLNTIQTTAHMLKGAASNLRLDTIAENLFKLQKESNLENSASLIKQFVGNIKGLEQEIASLEDAEDEN